jgi:protein kinase A/protein kinase X
MVLEYIVGGEFFTHLRKAGRFDHTASKFYATQIILVFEFMHSSDYIYRDLKPENVLMDENGYTKISDLGLAARISKNTGTSGLCGKYLIVKELY